MQATERTIFALATGAGRAAIAIIRLSGSGCGAILGALCRGETPAPRRATVRALWSADDLLDRALVLWFPGPNSYTGEDSAELHLMFHRAIPGYNGVVSNSALAPNFNYTTGVGTPIVYRYVGAPNAQPAGLPQTPSNP